MSSPSLPLVPPPYSLSNPSNGLNTFYYLEDLDNRDEFLIQNGHNFSRSDVPIRILFYMNEIWHDFKGETLESLRSGFKEGKTFLQLRIEGFMYTFDFLRMRQTHILSKNQKFIAWIDEKGKPFFPVWFMEHHLFMSPPKYNIMVQDMDDKKGKRKIDLKEVTISGNGGTKQKNLVLTTKLPNAKPLKKNDKTYMYTIDLFFSNIANIDMQAVVTDIQEFRIFGSESRARWNTFYNQIEVTRGVRGKANIVYAWYAVPGEKVVSIFSNGFELISNPPGSRPSLGAGIFLADLKSPQYSGMQYKVHEDPVKHVILCEVILGNVEKVELEFHQSSPSREIFDTGSDNPKDPTWYVVWANDINTRIHPVCVITCKTSAILPVDWSLFTHDTVLDPRVMLELKKRVPLFNLPPLQDIYDRYKNGRVTREVYRKQLRAIVSDEMIKEITDDISGNK